MARGTMHPPKPGAARRNAPQHGETTLRDDGVVRGVELAGEWSDETRHWHETWRRSPQAQLFLATDWGRLALLAPIVEAYFRRPSAAALSEIRMNEERLGATVVDRMRARMRVVDDEPDDAPAPRGSNVTPISASRASIRARMAADPAPEPAELAATGTDDDPAPF